MKLKLLGLMIMKEKQLIRNDISLNARTITIRDSDFGDNCIRKQGAYWFGIVI